MRRTLIRLLATGAAVATASAVGVVAVSAATSPPSSTPSSSAKPHHPGIFRVPRVVGEVVSDSAGGGALGKGSLVIKEPDGTQVTLSLTATTKAWKYQGMGVKPVAETPSALPAGEVVVVAGRGLRSSKHLARHILDLGFQAAS